MQCQCRSIVAICSAEVPPSVWLPRFLGVCARRSQEPKFVSASLRLISSGPIFIAEAKKFFDKVNLDVELKYFADGALAMPALVAGELDLTASTLNAGLFNAVAKGAPYKLILDRGIEKPGSGSMTIVASNAMIEAGFTSVDKAKPPQRQEDRDPGARQH